VSHIFLQENSPDAPAVEVVKTLEELQALKNVTLVVYGLQALSFFFGGPALIGLIINYVKRDDARGTLYESHFNWQIRTFWWGLAWFALGCILVIVGVGLIILFASWVWVIYRVVKGWLKLIEGKAV
jgi:uncharacterized membrane protein